MEIRHWICLYEIVDYLTLSYILLYTICYSINTLNYTYYILLTLLVCFYILLYTSIECFNEAPCPLLIQLDGGWCYTVTQGASFITSLSF